jgi:Protein of unknown function (DUF998)
MDSQTATVPAATTHAPASTRVLLTAGILAGPMYVGVGLIEAFTRAGYDLTRHSLSLLANGDLGWIHMLMLVTTGFLTIAGAVGLGRALGRSRAPLLIGNYGAALVAAGLLVADPALGFPPGTPDGPPVVYSWHGIGHFVAGAIGFLCLIAACFVMARRFRAEGSGGWAIYSGVTGVVFLAGFIGIASGNQSPTINLAFGAAVVVAWTWITLVFARARAQLAAR